MAENMSRGIFCCKTATKTGETAAYGLLEKRLDRPPKLVDVIPLSPYSRVLRSIH